MGYPITQNQTAQPLVFFLALSSDHISGATGLTPTVTLSKNGAAFTAPSGAISEIGNGWYKVAGNATDSNTLGPLLLHATGTGADPTDDCFPVVAYGIQDAVRLGLTALPNVAQGNAGALLTSGTGTAQLSVTGGVAQANATQINGVATTSVTAVNANVGTTQPTNFTGAGASALVQVDTRDFLGQAVQLDANNLPRVDVQDYAGSAVGSQPYTGTPPTAAAIATAVWTDLTNSSDFTTAGSVGALVTADLNVALSTINTNVLSRLAASSYTTPPTVAQIATGVWTDLLASSDFSTAASIGNLLKTDIDTNIGSRLATSGYTPPPSTAAIASAVMADVTDTVGADVVAIKAQTDKLTFSSGNVNSAPQTTVTLAAAGLDNVLVEAGITASASLVNDAGTQLTAINARQSLALCQSLLAGLLSGVASNAPVFKAAGKPGVTRLAGTNDTSDDRTAATITLPT